MRFTKFAATSALVIAALGVSAGTAYAEPAPASNSTLQTDVAPGIHYRASLVDHSVVVSTDSGSMAARDGQFQVLDGSGRVVAALPLSYQRDGLSFPIAAAIDGNTATLTPSVDRAAATPVAKGVPDLRYVDATANPNFNQALSNLSSEISIGVAIGTLVGTAIGAGIGCVAGGIVSGLAGAAVTIGTLAVPAAIGGCLVTGAALAAMGAVAGTIIIGGPVVAVALIQFFADVATPPVPAPAP
ncbi:hypothetical protein NDR87_25000 [Nocardia sp. CDC159]|uniref:DUF8020 domain-containing protein n=1 Tax=Nocardia pulmonis TaxID=2951408 RepID=A0A9X2IWQ1_9NOCA|nr:MULTISPECIES: hypothetical protein [Nocardia]MCM6775162.1 hypothetical protein [Nocardia pulmonis]MCM6789632.1 hypothetical protein [Nocardia sp. CDC159]